MDIYSHTDRKTPRIRYDGCEDRRNAVALAVHRIAEGLGYEGFVSPSDAMAAPTAPFIVGYTENEDGSVRLEVGTDHFVTEGHTPGMKDRLAIEGRNFILGAITGAVCTKHHKREDRPKYHFNGLGNLAAMSFSSAKQLEDGLNALLPRDKKVKINNMRGGFEI